MDRPAETAAVLDRGVRRLARQLRRVAPAEELGGSRLLILGLLCREGPLPATRVAAALRVQPQSLTRLLSGLAAEGLVERRSDPSDRRQSLLAPTAGGRLRFEASLAARQRRLAAALSTLTPAEQALLAVAGELMERLAEALAVHEGPAEGAAESDA